MKFLSQCLQKALNDLDLPHRGVTDMGGLAQAELETKVAASEVFDRMREIPKYEVNMRPNPYGMWVMFESVNVPSHQALVDICLDFTVVEGMLVRLRASMKRARVITPSGEMKLCLSPDILTRTLRTIRAEELADMEAMAFE